MRRDYAERIEQTLRTFQDVRDRIARANEETRTQTVEVSTRDGQIRVTVGAGGAVTDLYISPRAQRDLDNVSLAAAIVSTIEAGHSALRVATTGRYREIFGPQFDPAKLLGDSDDSHRELIRDVSRHLYGGR